MPNKWASLIKKLIFAKVVYMNTKNIQLVVFSVLALSLGLAIGYYFGYDIGFEKALTPKLSPISNNEQQSVAENETFDLVKIDNVKTGDSIASPVLLKGEAVGNWYFEATFPIEITDLYGAVLGQGYVQAQSEWMTTDFVPYEGEVSFDPQGNTEGYIVFKKDNPSGLLEHEDSRQLRIKFQ